MPVKAGTKGSRPQEIGVIKQLNQKDRVRVACLQQAVVAAIKNPATYYPLQEDEIILLLSPPAISLGAWVDEELVGYAAAGFPEPGQHNLGVDLGLDFGELSQVAHLEVGIVHPDYQGCGWQYRLYQELIQTVAATGRCRYLLSTVAPDNYPALSNSLRLGLYIRSLGYQYDDKLRYLLIRDCADEIHFDPDNIQLCPLDN